jgi:hypothetical protein
MFKPLAVGLAAALLFSSTADAQVRVSGFGQVVAGQTTGSNTSFPGGYDDELDFKQGSLFGVQISADLSERITATGQIVARGAEDFDADFAWAYLGIKLDHGFNLTLGRQRTAFFRYSDFLDVGYAYPWLFAPRAVYNLDFNNADGASLGWSRGFGDWFSQAKLFYGRFDDGIGEGDSGELKQFTGLSWDLNYDGWLSLRGAYFQADISLQINSLNPLLGALNQFGLAQTARLIEASDDKGRFKNVGFEIDRNNWLVVGEWTETRSKDTILPINDNFYLSAGYRFGKLMPHLTWGKRDGKARDAILASLPAQHPLFNTVAGAVASQALDDTYAGLGLRWDFARNVALKADYVRYRSDIATRQDSNLIGAGVVFTF